MNNGQAKQLLYHVNEIYKILEESEEDMSTYSKELGILKLVNAIFPVIEQLDAIIEDPTHDTSA